MWEGTMTKFIEDIKNNYKNLEHELVTQLSYEVAHNVTTGTNREEIWVDFFKRIIPKKFKIARSVFIIDSNSNCSKEVDIAIYDEQYTPYIFNYGNIKFIPIEAVAAVVQCKSKTMKPDILLEWVNSITALKTSDESIVRVATYVHIGNNKDNRTTPIQTATTPIKILCYISKNKTANKKNKVKDSFDIVIEAYQKKTHPKINTQNLESTYSGNLNIVFKKNENLYDILCQYNRGNQDYEDDNNSHEKLKERKISDYVIENKKEKYTLLSFIFQFNQMLMMINNPMFFPHIAYVKMFNERKEKIASE